MRKPTKTISGVTPVAVVISPRKCPHGTCLYCPSLNVPQSYTPRSPAIMRAAKLRYDPLKQIVARLKAFKAMGHPTDKIELIIMGGTFLAYPHEYQYKFIKKCYDALNSSRSKNLEQAKKRNEKAQHRCVALCIETRPDFCSDEDIKRMLEFGCTRVELGVQAVDDKIYKINKRGHTVKQVIEATKRLKDAWFKVFYHIMPGLPGSSPRKDLRMFRKLFSDEKFRPDGLKIYPTQVILGSQLVKEFEKKKYEPYSDNELVELLVKMKSKVPEYCRIMRVMREIPPEYLVAGTIRIDLRKVVNDVMKQRGLKCQCIRCREIGFVQRDNPKKKIDMNLKSKMIEYKASGGKEIFLEIVNRDNVLFGLCRLRVRKEKKEIKGAIRELHVYGQSLPIGERSKNKLVSQHKGIGKELVEKAEEIAKNNGVKELYVIAGIGAREYFYKQGYKLNGPYVSKNLK